MACACNNNNSRNQNALFERIGRISFVCDELRLFLDTHPLNTEALSMMKEYIAERNSLMEEYRNKYGSLQGYEIGNEDTWTWNEPPMPWDGREGGC